MKKIRKGDIVGRISYGKDILFIVNRILECNDRKIAILKGLTLRIEADAPIEDLVIMDKTRIQNHMRSLDKRLETRINKIIGITKKVSPMFKQRIQRSTRDHKTIYTGKILHLDGDKKYTDKSLKYYRELGLNAVVRNIAENKQPFLVKSLLEKYKPDILVITGHDGMIKTGTGYHDIYNYRNSKYFIHTVREARNWDKNRQLVIFAGACQSFFEALMSAGANFASSPARVLIDFADPLIVAEKIATTESYKYVTIEDIAPELRDGMSGVGGTGAKGKQEILTM